MEYLGKVISIEKKKDKTIAVIEFKTKDILKSPDDIRKGEIIINQDEDEIEEHKKDV